MCLFDSKVPRNLFVVNGIESSFILSRFRNDRTKLIRVVFVSFRFCFYFSFCTFDFTSSGSPLQRASLPAFNFAIAWVLLFLSLSLYLSLLLPLSLSHTYPQWRRRMEQIRTLFVAPNTRNSAHSCMLSVKTLALLYLAELVDIINKEKPVSRAMPPGNWCCCFAYFRWMFALLKRCIRSVTDLWHWPSAYAIGPNYMQITGSNVRFSWNCATLIT